MLYFNQVWIQDFRLVGVRTKKKCFGVTKKCKKKSEFPISTPTCRF